MKKTFLFFLFLFLDGVAITETVDVKTVSVNEGESFTLHTDTELQTDDVILWIFLSKDTLLAQFYTLANKTSLYGGVDGRFRDRLNLNHQTGSLTITNTTAEHTGLYQVEIINSRENSYRRFGVTVHAHLPIPVIVSPRCTSSESPNCSLLCSVMNVAHVTLSWYKGNSLFSSISVSDLNIRLSLPLEVEYQDINTYSCVVTNSSSNQTQHFNITDVCRPCSIKWEVVSEDLPLGQTILICVAVVLLIVTAVGIFCIYRKFRTDQDGQMFGEELTKLNGAEMMTVADIVKNIKVKAGNSIKLDTGVTDIQTCDLVQWKFAEAGDTTNPYVPIVRIKKNNEELLYNSVNGKLGNRLKLNQESGSLTIENSRTSDSGLYKLEINNSTNQVCKSFLVTVSDD